MDAAASVVTVDLSCFEEKDGLPVEAFAKVHEIFSHVDWLDPKTDAALNVLQQITASNVVQGRVETDSPGSVETSTSLQELITEKVQGKQKPASSEDNAEKFSSFALENKHFLSQKTI
ncbi:Formin-like protein 18 [Vitis vinifera]|uniref:Formin-like protein 18 n=1 Tax=Vitis vinifera TaxID=29760 RepID=A0A438GN48_VITVI|nr:Formin-like protein 18 [Vitis vinifera]